MNLKELIREIPDYPKKGINFKDITTLLKNSEALDLVIDSVVKEFQNKGITKVLGLEARGFIFGGAIASKLNAGFVPVRKKGKLPSTVISETYALEYGQDSLEIHCDAFKAGSRVLIIDDLLATGGTALAMINLAKKLKAKVAGIAFLIELTALGGRKKLKGHPIVSLIKY